MHDLSEFLDLLCGHFDNREQFEQRQAAGDASFPFARHVNTICNQKISGLPADFPGRFLLEESYYTVQGRTNASPPPVLLHPGGGWGAAHLLRPAPGAGPQELVL